MNFGGASAFRASGLRSGGSPLVGQVAELRRAPRACRRRIRGRSPAYGAVRPAAATAGCAGSGEGTSTACSSAWSVSSRRTSRSRLGSTRRSSASPARPRRNSAVCGACGRRSSSTRRYIASTSLSIRDSQRQCPFAAIDGQHAVRRHLAGSFAIVEVIAKRLFQRRFLFFSFRLLVLFAMPGPRPLAGAGAGTGAGAAAAGSAATAAATGSIVATVASAADGSMVASAGWLVGWLVGVLGFYGHDLGRRFGSRLGTWQIRGRSRLDGLAHFRGRSGFRRLGFRFLAFFRLRLGLDPSRLASLPVRSTDRAGASAARRPARCTFRPGCGRRRMRHRPRWRPSTRGRRFASRS